MINIKTDNFKSMNISKNEIVAKLASDENLLKCLLCPKANFLDFDLTTVDDTSSVIWDSIFPCSYVVDTNQTSKSYVTMSFMYEPSDKPEIWKVANITVYAFCHKNIVKTDYGFLRYDYMVQRIDTLLCDSRGSSWYNRLKFAGAEDIIIDEKGNFVGMKLYYTSNEKLLGS